MAVFFAKYATNKARFLLSVSVVPAKAGTHHVSASGLDMDPRLRGDDGNMRPVECYDLTSIFACAFKASSVVFNSSCCTRWASCGLICSSGGMLSVAGRMSSSTMTW